MEQPLVSIICLCYNQARFVIQTLEAVFNQTYPNIEIIVIDDGSTDGSSIKISDFLSNKPEIVFLDLKTNHGNTAAFNQGLLLAKGKYIIDLACDDIMALDRIEKQIAFFELLPDQVGVIYSDATYISEDGAYLATHFANPRRIPYEGDVYEKVISEYFIPPPTMMIKKEVLDQLGGYDEALAYEDFDFWVRSARNWHFAFQNEITTKIRRVSNSLSHRLYQLNDKQLQSTIKICHKIHAMNQSDAENLVLIKRLKYEIKHAFLTGNKKEVDAFINLHLQIGKLDSSNKLIKILNPLGINWSTLRQLLIRINNCSYTGGFPK